MIIYSGGDEDDSTADPQRSAVAIQLAVIPGLHVSPVVLIEVGQAVIHEDVALQGRQIGTFSQRRNLTETRKTQFLCCYTTSLFLGIFCRKTGKRGLRARSHWLDSAQFVPLRLWLRCRAGQYNDK